MPLIVSMQVTDPALGAQPPRRLQIDVRLSIGRGADNDLVLVDPSRVLSKNHCVIEASGSGYVVIDRSTNGVFLNNSPERLPRDMPTALQPGDLLQVGGYAFEVTALQPGAATADFGDEFAPCPPTVAERDPFDDLLADFGAEPKPTSGQGRPGGAGDFTPFQSSAFDTPLTDHKRADHQRSDPFLDPPVQRPLLPEADDLFGPPSGREEWVGGSEADHVDGPNAFFAPPKVVTPNIPDDWDELLDFSAPARPAPEAPTAAGPAAAAPVEQPMRNAFDEPSLEMPPVARPAPQAPHPTRSAAAPATAADRGAVAALLAATGVTGVALDEAQSIAVMERVGRMLAALVPGLMEILAARGSTKQEFHIERTMLGAHDNNPLKFAGSVDEAMRVMLLQHVPGFLPVDEAVTQALGDVKAHQLAVLAGMQTALKTVIGRFEPGQLEARLERSSLLEGILPQARKAKYWDLFRALHGEIVRELQDDLQKLFGADFAEAYRAQVERLAAGSEAESASGDGRGSGMGAAAG
ncbi:phosphopeptide-binding protein [Aliidongia dinghuensis]|uniref:Phosphopeptide-binding protein n=1 Tax=Aliidongia dinghuensis TaxID=1867774 RepID=A0A8J2YS51_9PROT|nr:type VI secretion system-associated FHA domain protein TagH [Aliidongia dinghuensis]GGF11174.1 phosphopeptide-binding protein [Aliidongia dinghuensis]